MNIKGFFFDSLGDSRLGELAGDSILAFPNQHDERLSLLVAGKLQASPEAFGGEDISLITSKEGKEMIIENIHLMDSPIEDFSHLIERKVWTLNNDHLGISLLLAKMEEENYFLNKAIEDNAPKEEIKQLKRTQYRGWIEIARRVSGALSVFTLTLLGCAFGIHIGRKESSKRIAIVIILSTLYLISYFVAKGMDHHVEAAIALYTAPHLLIWTASIYAIWRSSRGLEA
jgi:lipopolysaccharide export system permease protein